MSEQPITGADGPAPPTAAMDVAGRTPRVREALEGVCSALLVTKPANIRWLTGFTGSNGALLVSPDHLIVATDARYAEQFEQQLETAGVDAGVIIDRRLLPRLIDEVGPVPSLGLESHHVTWQQQQQIEEELEGASLVAVDRLIEGLREVKDDGEVDRLERAAAIADEALALVMNDRPHAVTERAIARRLESTMVDLGADGPSFPTIVAAGPNSARPHATPTDRPLLAGDLLVIDIGARVDGYGSDMTRTFVVEAFTAETDAMYQAVAEAQRAGVEAVQAGVSTQEVDTACRQLLTDKGLGDEFVHGTGHGIGLEIHESPFLGKSDPRLLRRNNVVTVEPGVYRPGLGGVRIEDSVIVTDDGCRPITKSPKNPILV